MRTMRAFIYFGVVIAALALPGGALAQDNTVKSTAGVPVPGTEEAEAATPGESSMPGAPHEKFPNADAYTPNMQHVFDQLPPDMQDELLKEMDQARAMCEANSIFSTYQDCECIAVKFLDKRLASGPELHINNVLADVGTDCVNRPAIAGYQYKECISRTTAYIGDVSYAERIEEMCSCVGRTVSDSYARTPANSLRYQMKLAVNAQMECGFNEIMRDSSIDAQLKEAEKNNYLP